MTVTRFLVHLVIAVLGAAILLGVVPATYLIRGWAFEREARVKVLYKTDHQALLDACRELSRRADNGDLKLGELYSVRGSTNPRVLTFPRVILDLQPTAVFLADGGWVGLQMCGGFGPSVGVKAYPENINESSHPGFDFGDKRLLEGLWYVDDGYDRWGKDYEKRIAALRPRRW